MTEVWVVMLNAIPIAICASRDRAGAVIDAEKRRLGPRAGGEWRPVGGDAWSAPQITSLRRMPMAVQG